MSFGNPTAYQRTTIRMFDDCIHSVVERSRSPSLYSSYVFQNYFKRFVPIVLDNSIASAPRPQWFTTDGRNIIRTSLPPAINMLIANASQVCLDDLFLYFYWYLGLHCAWPRSGPRTLKPAYLECPAGQECDDRYSKPQTRKNRFIRNRGWSHSVLTFGVCCLVWTSATKHKHWIVAINF